VPLLPPLCAALPHCNMLFAVRQPGTCPLPALVWCAWRRMRSCPATRSCARLCCAQGTLQALGSIARADGARGASRRHESFCGSSTQQCSLPGARPQIQHAYRFQRSTGMQWEQRALQACGTAWEPGLMRHGLGARLHAARPESQAQFGTAWEPGPKHAQSPCCAPRRLCSRHSAPLPHCSAAAQASQPRAGAPSTVRTIVLVVLLLIVVLVVLGVRQRGLLRHCQLLRAVHRRLRGIPGGRVLACRPCAHCM